MYVFERTIRGADADVERSHVNIKVATVEGFGGGCENLKMPIQSRLANFFPRNFPVSVCLRSKVRWNCFIGITEITKSVLYYI